MKRLRIECKKSNGSLEPILGTIGTFYHLTEDGSNLIVSDSEYFRILDIIRVEKDTYKLDFVCDGTDDDVKKAYTVEKLLGRNITEDTIRALGM